MQTPHHAIVRRAAGLLCAMLLLLAAGCARRAPAPRPGPPGVKPPRPYTVYGRTYHPLARAQGFEETGLASWYGPNFHGRRTSSGEIYDMEAMTAAHKILPLDTWVEVTNLENGRKVVVRINDRGPFVDGRIIDLSKAAARKLGIIGPGTARVHIRALGYRRPGTGVAGRPAEYQPPASYRQGPFTVQVGAFLNESNAWRLAARLRTRWPRVMVVRYDRGDKVFHRVRVGKLDSLEAAMRLQQKLRRAGFRQAFAVAF